MVRDDEASEGIDNLSRASKENVYEYRDTPVIRPRGPRMNHDVRLHDRYPSSNRKFGSTPSLRSNSNNSLKDARGENFVTSSPNGHPRAMTRTASQGNLPKSRSRTHLVQGVPQTAV